MSPKSRRKKSRAPKRDRQVVDPDCIVGVAFSTFAFLWSVALLFDFLQEFSTRAPLSKLPSMASLLVAIGAGIWILLKPDSVGRLLLLSCAAAVAVFIKMPRINNHETLILILSMALVGTIVGLQLKQGRRAHVSAADVYRAFAPAAALCLLVLYFWAAVHKFNTGYFDKDLSCATMQLFNLHFWSFLTASHPTLA